MVLSGFKRSEQSGLYRFLWEIKLLNTLEYQEVGFLPWVFNLNFPLISSYYWSWREKPKYFLESGFAAFSGSAKWSQTGASPREMSADDKCVVMVLMELSPVSYRVLISLAFESPDWFL